MKVMMMLMMVVVKVSLRLLFANYMFYKTVLGTIQKEYFKNNKLPSKNEYSSQIVIHQYNHINHT